MMLWKTQLLELLAETPKAQCVECIGINPNHRFFSYPSPGDEIHEMVPGSDSDLSSHSVGLSSHNGRDPEIEIQEEEEGSIEKLEELIQTNLKISNFELNNANNGDDDGKNKHKVMEMDSLLPSYTNYSKNKMLLMTKDNNSIGKSEDELLVDNEEIEKRRRSIKTAAAPWHRPSIYYFNPFGSAFHGNLSRSLVKRMLAVDGQFLVRKRTDDGDDEFVLSIKFNGRVKNFLITFDDTSGLIYLGNREKGFEHLEDLVQEGLVTMYVEHKAGPYIELLYDLTRNNDQHGQQRSKYLDTLSSKTKESGTTFTADCIYEFFEQNKQGDLHGSIRSNNKFRQSNKKQNSPSPVSSLSGNSLERARQPDLKSHSFKSHSFQQLSKCDICRNFLWGLKNQGLFCSHCNLTIHETCIAKVNKDCEPNLSQIPTIFGESLTLMVKATPGTGPPFVLQKCISEIDKRGLHVEGIYRISGSREATERLKNILERDRNSADLSGHTDIHSMCNTVKQFLRLLPEPLISEEVFETFLNSNLPLRNNNDRQNTDYNVIPTPTPTVTVELVRKELKNLLPAHYITLKYLLQHLHRVAQQSELNKMNPFNLASVWIPSLVCPSQISIETLQTGTLLLELMITQVRNLFPK